MQLERLHYYRELTNGLRAQFGHRRRSPRMYSLTPGYPESTTGAAFKYLAWVTGLLHELPLDAFPRPAAAGPSSVQRLSWRPRLPV